MSAGHYAPLTPPLTENDAQQLLLNQNTLLENSPQASGAGTATSVYSDVFPTISNLVLQNHLSDLIQLAEDTELSADSVSRHDESRLLLIAPLVLSYIIANDLSPARFSLTRLPESLTSHGLCRALLKLVAAVQSRTYPLVYRAADELLALVQGDFFSSSLAALIKLLVERLIIAFRRQTAVLLAKAYTSLPILLAQTYLNLPEDDVCKVMDAHGWKVDKSTKHMHAPAIEPANATSTVSGTDSVSSLSTVRLLIGGASLVQVAGS